MDRVADVILETDESFIDTVEEGDKKVEGKEVVEEEGTITVLDNKISFVAIGNRTKVSHDESVFGKKPCSFYSICSRIFK